MLAKINRLSRQKDFDAIFAQKGQAGVPGLAVKIAPNQKQLTRFAVVVSTKISKSAVSRNRIRRRLYEILRKNLADIKTGFDAVIIVKSDLESKKPEELSSLFISLLRKTKLL